ncbi:terpene synthase family protein [Streptomyces virginiae]|uniref:terpene synthase family protein n=1 Tax=Streptomyces virginiae TaxID=1961 RepID=UPI003251C144
MPPLSPAIDKLPFYCPIPPAPHPRPEALDSNSVQWMVDHGICAPDSWLAQINSGHVASTMVPLADADSPALHMSLFSDFCYWAYAWDDSRDARLDLRPPGALTSHCLRLDRILDHPGPAPHESDPYCQSLWDLRRRLAELPDSEQVNRVNDGTRRYIHGSYQWTRMQRSRSIPALNDYLLARSDDCAGSWMVPFYPLIGGYRLTPEEAGDPLALILTDLVPLIGALDNDIISHHREAAIGEFNVLDVLRNQNSGYPLTDAVIDAIALRDRLMTLYVRIRDHLARTGGPHLARFAHDIGYIVRGHMEWALETSRYRTPQDAKTGELHDATAFTVDWTDHPADDNPQPPDLPAITWWWDHIQAAEANRPARKGPLSP